MRYPSAGARAWAQFFLDRTALGVVGEAVVPFGSGRADTDATRTWPYLVCALMNPPTADQEHYISL